MWPFSALCVCVSREETVSISDFQADQAKVCRSRLACMLEVSARKMILCMWKDHLSVGEWNFHRPIATVLSVAPLKSMRPSSLSLTILPLPACPCPPLPPPHPFLPYSPSVSPPNLLCPCLFFFLGCDKDLEGKGCCKRKQMNHVVNAGPVILCYGIFSRAEIKFRASSNNKSRWQGSLVEWLYSDGLQASLGPFCTLAWPSSNFDDVDEILAGGPFSVNMIGF